MKKHLPFYILLLAHLFLLIQTKFTAWPEMLSFPYLINNGYQLYRDFVHVYPPLLTTILAAVTSLFGYHVQLIMVITWTLILLNDLLIYKILLQLQAKKHIALLTAGVYALLSLGLEGNMLWYDNALVTPVLAGVYFLLKKTKYSLYLAGFLFACPSLIKQTGAFYLVAAVIFVYFTLDKKKLIQFVLPPVLVSILMILLLFVSRQFEWFWNWVVYYPTRFWSQFPGYVDFQLTTNELLTVAVISLPPIILLMVKRNKISILMIALYAVGLFAVYPRFSYFHLQVAIALSMISLGLLFIDFYKFAVFLSILFFVIITPNIKSEWNQGVRFYEDSAYVLAKEIQIKTNNSNSIYLLGLPSHLYLLTQSTPPKPWLDNYGWYFEILDIEQQTLASWQNNAPAFIIWQEPNQGNWYDIGVYQPKRIVNWIDSNYKEVGKINDNIRVMKRSNI